MGAGELHYRHAHQSHGKGSGMINSISHVLTIVVCVGQMLSVLASSWECILW